MRAVMSIRRPPPDEKRNEVFQIRLSPSERQRLDELAAKAHMSPSEYLRSLFLGDGKK